MSLSTEMETQGQWLFRWRSYLPFVFVPCLTWEVLHSEHDSSSWWWHQVWPMACWCVSVLGLFVRVHCVGHAAANTSGRNTRTQIADSLNVTGMYSVVRHPLYLGNFLIALGIVAHPASFWLLLCLSCRSSFITNGLCSPKKPSYIASLVRALLIGRYARLHLSHGSSNGLRRHCL